MDVSIVIRTKNEGECIDDTLSRIQEQDFGGEYETIVVDSGSTDSTLDIVKRHNVRLLRMPQEEFTYGRSLNMGASHSKGQFIVNLSAHALPKDERWLTNLIGSFEDGSVAGVYGRQLSQGDVNPFEALRNELFFGLKKVTFTTKDRTMLKEIHFSNSNCAVRKGVWEKFRFNEQVPWAEDILWQREVIQAGFSIAYAPGAAVYHTHRVNVRDTFRISRNCASTLALMTQKRQTVAMVVYDMGIFLYSVPNSLFQNLNYILRNNYTEYLSVAPLYVMSEWFGWLAGRIGYRLAK